MVKPTLIPAFHYTPGDTQRTGPRRIVLIVMVALVALAAAINRPASAAPAAGDTYVYRVINGYNNEVVGHLNHEITSASTAQGQAVLVTPDTQNLGLPRTEMYAPDGQWLRHPLDSHGLATDYEFKPALPALQTPAAGKSWSVRVNATAQPHSLPRSVRVDGAILGNERIRVPAGEFDTIKFRRIIYTGDARDFKTETRMVEIDWYAPALGRSVRTETSSTWEALCDRRQCTHRGDWHIAELTEVRAATQAKR